MSWRQSFVWSQNGFTLSTEPGKKAMMSVSVKYTDIAFHYIILSFTVRVSYTGLLIWHISPALTVLIGCQMKCFSMALWCMSINTPWVWEETNEDFVARHPTFIWCRIHVQYLCVTLRLCAPGRDTKEAAPPVAPSHIHLTHVSVAA